MFANYTAYLLNCADLLCCQYKIFYLLINVGRWSFTQTDKRAGWRKMLLLGLTWLLIMGKNRKWVHHWWHQMETHQQITLHFYWTVLIYCVVTNIRQKNYKWKSIQISVSRWQNDWNCRECKTSTASASLETNFWPCSFNFEICYTSMPPVVYAL